MNEYSVARIGELAAENARLREQLAAEREVGHNTAVSLGQQIIKLEDQVAVAVEALKRLNQRRWYDGTGEIIQEALTKIGGGA